MQGNLLFKVTPKNKSFPLFISDNNSTFFMISDNEMPDDGLWFNNEKLLKCIIPESKDNTIENKTILIDGIQVSYSKKASLDFYFLRDANGLLAEIKSNRLIPFPENNYNLIFNIDRNFQILEKNIRNIILEYEVKDNKKDFNKLFLSINLSIDHNFENILQKGSDLFLSIKSIEKTSGEPFFYLLYSYNYDELKRKNQLNSNKLTELKKDQTEKADRIFENLKFNYDDKDINKFVAYVSVQSNFLIKNINNKIIGFVNQFPDAAFVSGIYTFASLLNLLLVTGRYETSREILLSFLNYQNKDSSSKDFSKIPSDVYSENEIVYGSSKITPLFLFCLFEYFSYTADFDLIIQSFEFIKSAVDKQFVSKSNNNKQNDEILKIDINLLWFAALLCVKQIINSIEHNRRDIEDSKQSKEILDYSRTIEDKIKSVKINSNLEDVRISDLLKEIHKEVAFFELSTKIDLNDFFNKPFFQEQKAAVARLSLIENFLFYMEGVRLICQEHIGIIPQIYERKIYISPEYRYNASIIKSEVRIGYHEKVSVNLKYNKKLSNVSFIEVKAEEIEKPLSIIVNVNLSQSKNVEENEAANIEILLNIKNDYFIISFEQFNEKTSKIKEIVTHGKSRIESVKVAK